MPELCVCFFLLCFCATICTYHIAVGHFAQARDAAQQEEEEKSAHPNLRKLTIKRSKRWCCSYIKKEIMSLTLDVNMILNLWVRIMCIV
jgi:hypothetical protein